MADPREVLESACRIVATTYVNRRPMDEQLRSAVAALVAEAETRGREQERTRLASDFDARHRFLLKEGTPAEAREAWLGAEHIRNMRPFDPAEVAALRTPAAPPPVERRCETCRHEGQHLSEPPCADCGSLGPWEKWEPKPTCSCCGNEIEPDVCGCGDGREGHGNPMDCGHSFVPLGCRCMSSDERCPDCGTLPRSPRGCGGAFHRPSPPPATEAGVAGDERACGNTDCAALRMDGRCGSCGPVRVCTDYREPTPRPERPSEVTLLDVLNYEADRYEAKSERPSEEIEDGPGPTCAECGDELEGGICCRCEPRCDDVEGTMERWHHRRQEADRG